MNRLPQTQRLKFERFLIRARRQWTRWTIAEFAALGLLSGCGVVLLLVPILLWRGQPGQTVAIVFPVLGAAAGAMAGIRNWPSLGEIAQQADDRFETADLLSTALAFADSRDPWNLAIVKMADACVVNLSPAQFTPHRLGRRAWSGITIALFAVITLGLLSMTTSTDRLEAASRTTVLSPYTPEDVRDPVSAMISKTRAAPEAHAERPPDSQAMESADFPSLADPAKGDTDQSNRGGQAETGAGGGVAKTDEPKAEASDRRPINLPASPATGDAIAAGGSGIESRDRRAGDTTIGPVSAGQYPTIAPWASSAWPRAQSAAKNAIQNGEVPAAYRSLVLDYFKPD